MQGRTQDFGLGALISAEVWAKLFRSEKENSACSGLFWLVKYNTLYYFFLDKFIEKRI